MDSCSKKTAELEFEKQEKWVTPSKKKQLRLQRKMQQAQAILKEKEVLVSKKEKKASLYGLLSSECHQYVNQRGEERL